MIDYYIDKYNKSKINYVSDNLKEISKIKNNLLINRRFKIYIQNRNLFVNFFKVKPVGDLYEAIYYKFEVILFETKYLNFFKVIDKEIPKINNLTIDEKKKYLLKLENENGDLAIEFNLTYNLNKVNKLNLVEIDKLNTINDKIAYNSKKISYFDFEIIGDLKKLKYNDLDSNIIIQSFINEIFLDLKNKVST